MGVVKRVHLSMNIGGVPLGPLPVDMDKYALGNAITSSRRKINQAEADLKDMRDNLKELELLYVCWEDIPE